MKLQVPFIQLPFLVDVPRLAAEICVFGEDAWRPHPLGYAGNSALALIAVDGDPHSDAFVGPMRPTPHLERCPYIRQVLGEIGAVWGRTRLMRLSGQAEVEPHVDINYYWHERVRVHMPIHTKPSVRFICGDDEINMAAGECWIFDTWRMHRVVNADDDQRIHLVADTVGSEGFWQSVNGGRAPGRQPPPGWAPRRIEPSGGKNAELWYESTNAPVVMTPWELRHHVGFVFGEAVPHPNLAAANGVAMRFLARWHALWARFGEAREGWPEYRRALDAFEADLRAGAGEVVLRNSSGFVAAMMGLVVTMALGDRPVSIAEQAVERVHKSARAAAG